MSHCLRLSVVTCLSLLTSAAFASPQPCAARQSFALVLHGGAGSWDRMPVPARPHSPEYKLMMAVLAEGHRQLASGASALDVVQQAVATLEDSGVLNAGKAAVPNRDGFHELDASIMEGSTLRAGAVAAVKVLKNPINAARLVMDETTHVLLVAEGAEKFARAQGATVIDPATYYTRHADTSPHGTVGAVATDRCASVAAATSTGGLTGKLPGRVGDSPIIGAGTYADDRTAAVSATGDGEFFIRVGVARDVAAMMEYKGLPVAEAARIVLEDKVGPLGGKGGLIAVDAAGNVATPFITGGMLRGTVREDGQAVVLFD